MAVGFRESNPFGTESAVVAHGGFFSEFRRELTGEIAPHYVIAFPQGLISFPDGRTQHKDAFLLRLGQWSGRFR